MDRQTARQTADKLTAAGNGNADRWTRIADMIDAGNYSGAVRDCIGYTQDADINLQLRIVADSILDHQLRVNHDELTELLDLDGTADYSS